MSEPELTPESLVLSTPTNDRLAGIEVVSVRDSAFCDFHRRTAHIKVQSGFRRVNACAGCLTNLKGMAR